MLIPAAYCAAEKVVELVEYLKENYPDEYESKYSYYNFDELKKYNKCKVKISDILEY